MISMLITSKKQLLYFDEFTILAYGYQKYILEIKESFLIKRDRTAPNENNSSAKLFFFSQ